ncbi:MAG: GntR family transcriptional regulator [Atopobiaceae bacterium]|nr:GntR family transcriptional regulator [Atopobiaceae bacterium]
MQCEHDISQGEGPLHVRLANIMREQIYMQNWPPGAQLPSEYETMTEYGVSRGTVKKAIQALVDEGLVEKRQGKGSFVSNPLGGFYSGSSLLSFAESFRMQGIDFETTVISAEIIQANEVCAAKLQVPLGTSVFFLRRVRSTDSGPLIYMESRLNLMSCPGLENYDYTKTNLFNAVEECSGRKIGYAKARYGARLAGMQRSRYLECDDKAPVLNIDQVIYLDDNRTAEWGNMWLPANRYVLVSVLQRM